MASQEGSGSILLKIIIVVLVIATIFVITVPGEIWQQEEMIMDISRGNMATIFDAHQYYNKQKGFYPESDEALVASIQNDSALNKRQIVVRHTTRLKNAMEEFLNTPVIKNLYAISSNLKNINNDFTVNKRFFKTIEEIDKESENIKQQISSLRSGIQFERYQIVVTDLDSMWQLRRDLTDYSLQSAARYASSFSEDIITGLPAINFAEMNEFWTPLSQRISDLMNEVNSTRLKARTSVADRVADFQRDIEDGFAFMVRGTDQTALAEASQASSDLAAVYRDFLNDFLITEEYVQYTMTESDSLLINISDKSFFTPTENLRYIVNTSDTSGIRVEDPTLLVELRNPASQQAELIMQLPIMDAFGNYVQQVESLKAFYPEVKAKYRRNIEVTIKNKEVEAAIEKLAGTAAFDAYFKYKSYTESIPGSDSYSNIKDETEAALISTGSFRQIYTDNFFGNLDTVHIEIINQLNQYNELVSTMRRNEFSFDPYIENLNTALSDIKSIPKEAVLQQLGTIEENLRSQFLFASEGQSKSVYGLFSTRIVNHGKISGSTGRKSWEE
jgi:hypothetical protein